MPVRCIQPPIFVLEKETGEIFAYETAGAVERDLESLDIPVYFALDSVGRLLHLKPSPENAVALRIEEAEEEPSHHHLLRAILLERLLSVGEKPERLRQCTLPELVDMALHRFRKRV